MCKKKCFGGLSSRVEYVGCAHENLAKSCLPMPTSYFAISSCFKLLVPAWHLLSSYSGQLVFPHLTDLDRTCAVELFHSGVQ